MGSFRALFVEPILIIFEVEKPGVIWAGNHTVPASYTPMVIHNNNTIITLICSLDRTDLGAWRIIAVIT